MNDQTKTESIEADLAEAMGQLEHLHGWVAAGDEAMADLCRRELMWRLGRIISGVADTVAEGSTQAPRVSIECGGQVDDHYTWWLIKLGNWS